MAFKGRPGTADNPVVARPLRELVRIRRHPLGPRVYLAGMRVHECAAGAAATLVLAMAVATNHAHHRHAGAAVGVVAIWMMAKDWPDFFAARRDTYAWRVGPHRRGDVVPCRVEAER
jgi:hypothetical protein